MEGKENLFPGWLWPAAPQGANLCLRRLPTGWSNAISRTRHTVGAPSWAPSFLFPLAPLQGGTRGGQKEGSLLIWPLFRRSYDKIRGFCLLDPPKPPPHSMPPSLNPTNCQDGRFRGPISADQRDPTENMSDLSGRAICLGQNTSPLWTSGVLSIKWG